MSRAASRQAGFTLVEIIIAIVIIGIIGAVTVSRLSGSNAFNATILRDQIVSVARNAQQNSLGRASVTFTITPSPSGETVELETSDSGGAIENYTLPLDSVSLRGDINDTDSCAATSGADAITNATPMTVTFEELGDLGTSGVTGSTGAVTSALRVCIDDSALASVCFSPSGFAYAGDCDV